MTQMVSHLEQLIMQLGPMLARHAASAQAIDRHDPWERIAVKAVDDGLIESTGEFARFAGICVRRGAR